MPGPHRNPDIPILNEYKQMLETEWTRLVACQNECGPDKPCTCLRYLVHVDALKAWWTRHTSDSGERSQLQRLLEQLPPAAAETFPLDYSKLFTGKQSCLRVFSLLLKQGRENLINPFYDSDMNDKYLDIVRSEANQSLHINLVSNGYGEEAEQITKDFHEEKWAYCPLELTLHMDRNLQGTKVIPPFCRKIKIGNKGGTASIYFVAIQSDLVQDEPLKLALHDSLHDDPDFGKCYKMALKSYCGNKKSAYDLEKSAFSALKSSHETPVVQYLGCYTHDYGEGSNMGTTYNLLLEFGEEDLYESWADETNVPPVRAQEIIRYWESLFDVALAIRHMHHLEVPYGKNTTLRYHGWHADIKPDNILLVHGQFKLADFGFSRFAPVVERGDGSIPTEFINGFTDTYGAPEVFRMKRTDGTLSGVTQSIDTWSFGCVLSVAATWIVLGFQGVRQYEQLRRLSPGNFKGGLQFDRFHNGTEVLPEVRKWHDYLRGHLRPSDTLTPMVLEMIEHDMLLSQPGDRFDSKEVCEKLKERTDWATKKICSLKKLSRETDAMVLKALLMFEEAAENQTISQEPRLDPSQSPSVEDDAGSINSRPKTTRQIQKENALKNKPLGQTAFRRDIIKNELRSHGIYWEEPERTDSEKHNGAITDSPIDTRSSLDMPFTERKFRRRNPQAQGISRFLSAARENAHPARRVDFGTVSTEASDWNRTRYHQTPREIEPDLPNGQPNSYPTPRDSPRSTGLDRHTVGEPGTPVRQQSTNPSWPSSPPRSSPRGARPVDSPIGSPPPLTFAGGSPIMPTSPPPFTPIDGFDTVCPPGWSPSPSAQSYDQTVPQLSHPTPNRHYTNEGYAGDRGNRTRAQTETPPRPGPSIILSQPVQTSPPVEDFHNGLHAVTLEYPVHLQLGLDQMNGHVNAWPPVPVSVYDLPFHICQRRKELDEDIPNRMGKLKGKLGFESRNKDTSLAQTFSERRELVLVIDNGWTMFTHWPIVTFVAETLAKNAAGLDKNGFDVRFTVEGHTHDKDSLRGDAGRSTLKTALHKAWPENTENQHSLTDMGIMFENIFTEWTQKGKLATTLLVLTDGVWSKTDEAKLNQTILNIAKRDDRHTGNRHFSIQFVRFGDAPHETSRLQWLDDELCKQANFRDIIDHCSWRTNVDKIFKGSIEGYQDQTPAAEPANPYHYPDLVALFDRFNDRGLRPPQQELQRSPSGSSQRSRHSRSGSSDLWRASMPLGRKESWHTHSRTPFST